MSLLLKCIINSLSHLKAGSRMNSGKQTRVGCEGPEKEVNSLCTCVYASNKGGVGLADGQE